VRLASVATLQSLNTYIANLKAKTGAEFEVVTPPHTHTTDYDYDYGDLRNHTYTKAMIQLIGTRYKFTVVWIGGRWRRGRG
jgi:hypothetical protein